MVITVRSSKEKVSVMKNQRFDLDTTVFINDD